jgi:LacI family transcriptional regulator
VAKLRYRPSFTARALAKGRTQTLGLVLGGISNGYFAQFAESVLAGAARRGYQLLISLSGWVPVRERQCLADLLDRQTDGILYYHALPVRSAVARRVRQEQFPLLLLDQLPGAWQTVFHDSRLAIGQALAHLQALGHARIEGVFPPSGPPQLARNYLAACKQHGVTPELLREPAASPDARTRIVEGLCRRRPPALICCGRMTVQALLGRIERDGLDYRPDIVMYYDCFTRLIEHGRIAGVVHCDSSRLVEAALATLLDRIENGAAADRAAIGLPAEFVPRIEFARLLAQEPEPAPRDY